MIVSFRFVSFRFVSFRFVSFRFVSFRYVSFRFHRSLHGIEYNFLISLPAKEIIFPAVVVVNHKLVIKKKNVLTPSRAPKKKK